jgi:hypothetical protein
VIALVLGCAENVWQDSYAILNQCSPDGIFACKDMIAKWPARIDYGCTLHPDRTDGYLQERSHKKYPMGFDVYAHRNFQSRTTHKELRDWAGSTGLFAVRVAIEMGFSGIVLAGVPMQKQYGHITRKEPWVAAKQFHNGWNKHREELEHCVRSMSGWTRQMFGTPTKAWFEQHGQAEPCSQILSILNQTHHDVVNSDGEL